MRKEQNSNRIGMTVVLVNEMRRMEEATERVRLVVKAMALREGVRYVAPTEVD